MLEIRGITKIYRSKTGQEVKALDNVSLTFPERGMVFVLGKSGSGKSTLLNVIGGLDGYDAGEFIIKGKSSREFGGADFDAYRNTFIGFIFQEYNILDDFSVGANIALALELQGKRATTEKINEILAQVDMLDYARRKPNELSGGQKQRVAIARALVKDPEIIMADEPTGALDSNTGRQIFDTLKALSREKLVIIVSHDRDFAELYGDRIIEMKDGTILSDVTKHEREAVTLSGGVKQMNDGILQISAGYELTAADLVAINAYLKNQKGDVFVSGDRRINDSVRTAAGITAEGKTSSFLDTDEEKDVPKKTYEKGKTKFIRSRLPMKNALKMGASGLSHKRFRLVMTIFLSLISFTLFGFANTVSSYNKFVAATDSILGSSIYNASFSLGVQEKWVYEDDESVYYYEDMFNEEDVRLLEEKTGLKFTPVYGTSIHSGGALSLTNMMKDTSNMGSVYTGRLSGFAVWSDSLAETFGYTGKAPTEDIAENEIVISRLLYEQLNHTGFENSLFEESVEKGQLTMEPTGKNSIIGKHLSLRTMTGDDMTFVIVGVANTGFDYARYQDFMPKEGNAMGGQDAGGLLDMVLEVELQNTLRYGFHYLAFTSESTMQTVTEQTKGWFGNRDVGTYMNDQWFVVKGAGSTGNGLGSLGGGKGMTSIGGGVIGGFVGGFDIIGGAQSSIHQIADGSAIAYIDNVKYFGDRTSLGEREYLLPISVLSNLGIMDWQGNLQIRGDVSAKAKAALMSAAGITEDELLSYFDNGYRTVREVLSEQANKDASYEWERQQRLFEEYCRDFAEAFFSRTYPSHLPASFYISLMDQMPVLQDNGEGVYKMEMNADTAMRFLAYEKAYTLVYGDGEDAIDTLSDDFVTKVVAAWGYDEDGWRESSEEYRKSEGARIYADYILNRTHEGETDIYGTVRHADLDGGALAAQLLGTTEEEYLASVLASLTISRVSRDNSTGSEREDKLSGYTIAGIYGTVQNGSNTLISTGLYNEYVEYAKAQGYGINYRAPHAPGQYAFVIAPMPTDREAVEQLVALSYDESTPIVYRLENNVMDTLDSFNDFIEIGAVVFLWVGVGFAVFAALMLMNFIATSISYKRHEIGILRAVGARSSDVFKIFFSEAAIIALINFALSIVATAAAVIYTNILMAEEGINVTLLHFGVLQVALMLVISLGVAAIASFMPVYNIARRKPIDAIRNK